MIRTIAIVAFFLSCAMLILLGCVAHYTPATCLEGKPIALLGALIAVCGMVILMT